MLAIEPVKGGIAATATGPMIEKATRAEIHPALETLEVFFTDALDRPLAAKRVNACQKCPIIYR